MILIAVIAIALFAAAAALGASALIEPAVRRREHIEGIDQYGYTSGARIRNEPRAGRNARKQFDTLATSVGDAVANRLRSLRAGHIQRDPISAGFFRVGARRVVAYRVVLTI